MDIPLINDRELADIGQLLHKLTGISLAPRKKHLVAGRLNKRLRHYGLGNYNQYYELVTGQDNAAELQVMVDLLTTNETYFFREPTHFEFLKDTVLPKLRGGSLVRAWSAASSSGEEAYTLAMLLSENLGTMPWQILGSDISTDVLAVARNGIYSLERVRGLSKEMMKKHCLKGVRSQRGTFSIKRKLTNKVEFRQINLNHSLPSIGSFDIIFLRNVLIYFDMETKQQIVARVLRALKPGGYFFISHAESLHNISTEVQMVKPSVFRRSENAGRIGKEEAAPCP
jgi:chemotaxis protein methyltransferase CheR|tara:strand:- start:1276 stop:2127 length:852 start_codon:yes stop_codon:yes gene_type:complete